MPIVYDLPFLYYQQLFAISLLSAYEDSDSTPGSDMARMGASFKLLKRDLARVRFVSFPHFFELRLTTFTSVSHKLPV